MAIHTVTQDGKRLYQVGSLAAIVFAIAYLVIIALYVPVGRPTGAEAWLSSMAENTARWWAILALDVLTDLLLVPIALSLYVALQAIGKNMMKRILLTGMSGTGKSTVIEALAARGYHAVDADCDAFSHWVTVAADEPVAGSPVEPSRDWVWREDRMQALLANEASDLLFVSGCAPNMKQFLPSLITLSYSACQPI